LSARIGLPHTRKWPCVSRTVRNSVRDLISMLSMLIDRATENEVRAAAASTITAPESNDRCYCREDGWRSEARSVPAEPIAISNMQAMVAIQMSSGMAFDPSCLAFDPSCLAPPHRLRSYQLHARWSGSRRRSRWAANRPQPAVKSGTFCSAPRCSLRTSHGKRVVGNRSRPWIGIALRETGSR
jgi:hypothetical protein